MSANLSRPQIINLYIKLCYDCPAIAAIFFSRQNFFDGALIGFEAQVDAWADSLFTPYCRKFVSIFWNAWPIWLLD